MALVVQTVDVVDGANSYVSLADAQQYADDRGIDVTLTEGHLLQGVDYVNSFRDRYRGYKTSNDPNTAMAWPRTEVDVDGYFSTFGVVIPEVVKQAQIEAAIDVAQGNAPHSTVDQRVEKRVQVGSISVEYETMSGLASQANIYKHQKVRALLRPVLKSLFQVTR